MRLKKLRGSGGYVMAQVTDEQQREGSLGGPDLFLAPIGRLDSASISKYHCNTCEKDFEGSPEIEYQNPNEQVAENLTLLERGQYKCRCGAPIAEYRKFSKGDEARDAGAAYKADQITQAPPQQQQQQQQQQPPPQQQAPQQQPRPEPRAEQRPQEPEATSINAIAGMEVYDEDARKVGTAVQVGVDSSHSIVLVISGDGGAKTAVPWASVKKVGQIILLGGAAAAPEPGRCKCGFANKAGAKFCEECGTSV